MQMQQQQRHSPTILVSVFFFDTRPSHHINKVLVLLLIPGIDYVLLVSDSLSTKYTQANAMSSSGASVP